MASTLKDTDRCVMCGMCLPQCPTYGKTRNEADSPRGRISLMQALDRGRLPMDAHLLAHLDGCLGCRACEAVCPSGVPYGALIDATRAELHARRPRGPRARLLARLARAFVEHRGARRMAATCLRLAQAGGLMALAGALRIDRLLGMARARALLPRLTRGWRYRGHAAGDAGARVALFTGCAGEVFDVQTLEASARLLERLGFDLRVPEAQTCCGALYQHNGEPARAAMLAGRNAEAFADPSLEAVISTATGCGAQLAEYAALYPGTADALAAKAQDISAFLARRGALEGRRFAALPKRVAVHTPCSLAHVLKGGAHPLALLRHIPGIELLELPAPGRCCGAAGTYMFTQPEMSDALLEDRLTQLRTLGPDLLVTSNVGCALHFKAGLARTGLEIEVLHPVTLLERQLLD